MEFERMPVRLDHARAWRTYIGGKMIDEWHGTYPGKDSNFPEEWIASLVTARNAGREEFVNEGLSRTFLKDGSEGPFLKDWIAEQGPSALGEKHWKRYGASLGVLVKLIDAGERLTVQVHPDRKTAERLFHSRYGKTECWYVLGGRKIDGEDPCVYFGFRKGVTEERWRTLFDKQDYEDMLACLHKIPVHRGDVILIEGGIPHAIGAGCFLTEIQEPTDYTIRVERVTPSGLHIADSMCHQGLGFDRMFECFHYDTYTEEEVKQHWFLHHEPKPLPKGGTIRPLVDHDDTSFFRMNEITLKAPSDLPDSGVFSALVVLQGKGTFTNARNETVSFAKGDQFFVPASAENVTIVPDGREEVQLLQCFGPKAA